MSVLPGATWKLRTLVIAGLAVGLAEAGALAQTAAQTDSGLDRNVGSDAPAGSPAAIGALAPTGGALPPLAAPSAPDAGPGPIASLTPGMTPASPAAPAMVQAVSLDHPTVLDTGRLQSGATVVSLYGIEGLSGEPVQGLQGFLATTDGHLTCQSPDPGSFVCLMTDGTDLAQIELVNGVALTRQDSPQSYRDQEISAQTARRGIWGHLPPPPDTVDHPVVPDTATLAAEGKVYPLDGLQGLGQPYAGQLQGYIAGNGDSLSCSQQGDSGRYICLSRDGTDIAKVALVNGAARVSPDAPDSYRVQQADAVNNRRGYWMTLAPDMLPAAQVVPQQDEYVLSAGDDGVDGISYVGGAPMAIIDGDPTILVYGDDLGWGYYDHWHHWRGAPDRFRTHLEHFHPYGHGLRGYRDGGFRHDGGMRRDAAYRHEDFGRREAEGRREGGFGHEGPARNMEARGEAMHAGGARPGMGPAGRPGAPGGGFAHAGAPGGGFAHAGAPGGGLAHAGAPGGGFAHAGAPGGGFAHAGAPMGGGFVHPGAMASAGGFRPGGAGGGFHAAAPAAHIAAAGGKHR